MEKTSSNEFDGFLRELRALMHRLQVMGSLLHGEDNLPSALRTLMAMLEAGGPCTMPQLARVQVVSRQQIRVEVRRLEQDGLVSSEPNPAHRTSHLIRLTGKGRRRLAALRDKEQAALADLHLPFRPGQVEQVSQGVLRIREALDQVCVELLREK